MNAKMTQTTFPGFDAVDITSSNDVVKSVSYDNGEIIRSILELHVPNHHVDCDPTYSKGNFYKNSGVKEPWLKFDISPQTDDTVQSDFRHLPLDGGSVDCIMFDPPFVISNGPSLDDCPDGSNIIHNRFSSFKNPQELFGCYYDALCEFYRVLRDNGVLIFKCQDTVSSGTNYMTHCYIHNMALSIGFYPKDLFVLNAPTRVISGKHTTQQHARKFHSYFWVFEKGNRRLSKVEPFSEYAEYRRADNG